MSEIIKDFTEEELHSVLGTLTVAAELFQKISRHAPTRHFVDSSHTIPILILAVIPGQSLQIVTMEEAERILPCFNLYDEMLDVANGELVLSYDETHVIKLREESFLIGPAILSAMDENGTYLLLDALNIQKAREWIAEHTVTLCADGRELSAIRLV